MADSVYAQFGVDTDEAERATARLVAVLATIDPGRPRRAMLRSGHYANVLSVGNDLGVAVSTDGVGSKAIVAEALGKFDTIGIDCVAMNVNDVICVGAEPIAMLDYISIAKADERMLEAIAQGLKSGAEDARIEIPGGEIAQLPDMIKSHGEAPTGFDLVGTCFGLVNPAEIITGHQVSPGDVIIGLPASGVHANGLSLARGAFPNLNETVAELGDSPVGEVLLTPTVIYVKAISALKAAGIEIHGLAHITSESFLNLLRLEAPVGYRITDPLPTPAIFGLIAERTSTPQRQMWDVFNMGCGFCCVVPASEAESALAILRHHHAGSAAIGEVTDQEAVVELEAAGLIGTRDERFQEA
jgi:phosphoribosylformylglycinamidine cyclo-ligase